jgi:hypothetical protein
MTTYVLLTSKYVCIRLHSAPTGSDAIQSTNQVAYVWAGPWTLGTFLFILNRYLPFVDIFILIQRVYFFLPYSRCYTDIVPFQYSQETHLLKSVPNPFCVTLY